MAPPVMNKPMFDSTAYAQQLRQQHKEAVSGKEADDQLFEQFIEASQHDQSPRVVSETLPDLLTAPQYEGDYQYQYSTPGVQSGEPLNEGVIESIVPRPVQQDDAAADTDMQDQHEAVAQAEDNQDVIKSGSANFPTTDASTALYASQAETAAQVHDSVTTETPRLATTSIFGPYPADDNPTAKRIQQKQAIMAEAAAALSVGSLDSINSGVTVDEPVVQCVQIKPMDKETVQGIPRFRVVWNDSKNFIQSMISQQSSWQITEDKLKKGSVCKLKAYTPQQIKDKTILVVLDLEVLPQYGEPEKIGNPVALDPPNTAAQEEKKPQIENIEGKGFYGNQSAAAQRPQPKQQSLPSRPNGSTTGTITPIEAISPYSHKWTIKARCTYKGPIKTWHKNSGEGKLFSCNFLDDSGEIRATGFNDSVDQWYDVLEEGSVYYVNSPCRVQPAKKQFSNTTHDYELTFERETKIEKAEDMDGVPQVRYNFTTLAGLQSCDKDTTTDCIGVLQEIGEVSQIVSKTTSKPYDKRELVIVDNTGFSTRLTIWGGSATKFDAAPESVVAFKGVKVSDFGGRSLSLLASGSMTVNPDIEEAHILKGWYQADGHNASFQSHANTMSTSAATGGGKQEYKTIGQVGDENLGMNPSGDTDWFTCKATIMYIKKDNFAYPACRTDGCNKKVVNNDPNEWRCEKCDKTWDSPEWRYVLSVNVADHTGQMWLSCFNDTGALIMGMSADDMWALKDEDDNGRLEAAFQAATLKNYVFRCKAKMDNFNDQQRVRYQVQSAQLPNFGAEAKKLANLIKQYSLNDDSLFVN